MIYDYGKCFSIATVMISCVIPDCTKYHHYVHLFDNFLSFHLWYAMQRYSSIFAVSTCAHSHTLGVGLYSLFFRFTAVKFRQLWFQYLWYFFIFVTLCIYRYWLCSSLWPMSICRLASVTVVVRGAGLSKLHGYMFLYITECMTLA